LAFRRQLYNNNAPPTDDINDNNMPRRRSKKPRPAEPTQHTNEVNLATVDWQDSAPVDITTNEDDRRFLANIPIQFEETGKIQPTSKLNFAFVASTTTLLHKFTWCVHQPSHGHFLEQSRDMAVPYSLAIAAESNAEARSTLQTQYAVPVIVEKLSDLHRHCTTCKLPNLEGYYGRVELEDRSSETKQAKLHSYIIAIM
jgi:hypothetical protein